MTKINEDGQYEFEFSNDKGDQGVGLYFWLGADGEAVERTPGEFMSDVAATYKERDDFLNCRKRDE